jgi:hypothetical protein
LLFEDSTWSGLFLSFEQLISILLTPFPFWLWNASHLSLGLVIANIAEPIIIQVLVNLILIFGLQIFCIKITLFMHWVQALCKIINVVYLYYLFLHAKNQ